MRSIKGKGLQLLLAATVTAMIVMPIAIAGATGPAATGSKASPAKQVKALKAQTVKLSQQAAALIKQIAGLEAKTIALEGKKAPTSLPPSGPAGGDLVGNFPNPQLGPNSVGSAEVDGSMASNDIGDGSVRSNDIGDASIASADLAPQSVGVLALGAVEAVVGNVVPVETGGDPVTATVACPHGRVLSGGYEWGRPDGNRTRIVSTSPPFPGGGLPDFVWKVVGAVEGGGADNTLFAEVLCLNF